MNSIELLSPAKTAAIGIEAILHGADAVYIGAEEFGARQAAGNSIEDIERLVRFAHIYRAKVYVTVNTIIKEDELDAVRRLITNLYNIGVDALIVQDMAILKMDIPPIALHASTQMHNTTPEKVKFLEDIGFTQVVLARECEVDEIREISKAVNVRLEAFVHGARCVSYSGRCYASAALTGRSANRGECAQICRLPFQLQDAQGHNLGTHNYLSIKDMDRSAEVEDMINAGVTSFKIEGRLKDADYVKNITAYYRGVIDGVLARHADWHRSSDGISSFKFKPDKFKSFFRGCAIYTPKSTGEYIGVVKGERRKEKGELIVKSEVTLHNGDGFCYFDERNEFFGFRANRVERLSGGEWRIETLEPVTIRQGCKLYRNYDNEFQSLLSKPTATRRISVTLTLTDRTVTMSDGVNAISESVNVECVKAVKDQTENIKSQLSKLGDTPYIATSVTVDTPWFFPMGALAAARRTLCERLSQVRVEQALESREWFTPRNISINYTKSAVDYTENIANSLARAFYAEHGVTSIEEAFELHKPDGSVPVMFCKHCVRRAIGACKKENTPLSRELQEPLHLIYKNYCLRLTFDCNRCVMLISLA